MSLYEIIKKRLNADIPSASDKSARQIRQGYVDLIFMSLELNMPKKKGIDLSNIDPNDLRRAGFGFCEALVEKEVQREYKKRFLLAELNLREAIESKAGGDDESAEQFIEKARKLLKIKSELGFILAEEDQGVVLTEKGQEEKADNFDEKEYLDTTYYKKARMIYDLVTIKDSTQRKAMWQDSEILSNQNIDFHDFIYHFAHRFIDYDVGVMRIREALDLQEESIKEEMIKKIKGHVRKIEEKKDKSLSERIVLLPVRGGRIGMKAFTRPFLRTKTEESTIWDPLAYEIVAMAGKDHSKFERLTNANPKNIRWQIEALETLLEDIKGIEKLEASAGYAPGRLNELINIEIAKIHNIKSKFYQIVNEYKRRMGSYVPSDQNIVAAPPKDYNKSAMASEYREFCVRFAKTCYGIVKREAMSLFQEKDQKRGILRRIFSKNQTKGRPNIIGHKGNITKFIDWPIILDHLLEYAIESYSHMVENENDFPLLIEMLAARGKFNCRNARTSPRTNPEIRNKLEIMKIYQEIYEDIYSLQDEKEAQFRLDRSVIETTNRNVRIKKDVELKSQNKRCLIRIEKIKNSFERLHDLVKAASPIPRMRYHQEMIVFLALLRRNDQEYRGKLVGLIQNRGTKDQQVLSMLREMNILNYCYRSLEPYVSKEDIENISYGIDMVEKAKEIFTNFKWEEELRVGLDYSKDPDLNDIGSDLNQKIGLIQMEWDTKIKSGGGPYTYTLASSNSEKNGIVSTRVNLLPEEYRPKDSFLSRALGRLWGNN